jgi:hypothetical protein
VRRYDTTGVSLRNSFVEPYVAVTVIAEAVQRPATGLVQSFDNPFGMERPVGQGGGRSNCRDWIIRYHGIKYIDCRVGYYINCRAVG